MIERATGGEAEMTEERQLTVFYNGACPICAREIRFYRRRRGADGLSWVDVGGFATEEDLPGLSKTEARLCVHLLYADGTLVSGGEALVGVWAALPGFRLWGRFFQAATSRRPHELPPGYAAESGEVPVADEREQGAVRRRFPFKTIVRLPLRVQR